MGVCALFTVVTGGFFYRNMVIFMSLISRIINKFRSNPLVPQHVFTDAIDWKETAPTALWALQEAYPDVAVLSSSSMEQLAAMYSNVPIEEGEAALGQELSHHGYALYSVNTGNDESVYLMLAAEAKPTDCLYVMYADVYRNDEDESVEPEELDARLLLQNNKEWGQKAKRIRSPKLNIRLPASEYAVWELSDHESFDWLNAERGLLQQEQRKDVYASTDMVRHDMHIVETSKWSKHLEGIEHMLHTARTHVVARSPIDWSSLSEHALAAHQAHLSEQDESVFAHVVSMQTAQGADSALFYMKNWFAVGSLNSSLELDEACGQRRQTPVLRSQGELWIDFMVQAQARLKLPIPEVFPIGAPMLNLTPEVELPQLPRAVSAGYWPRQVFTGRNGDIWVDCSFDVGYQELACLKWPEKEERLLLDALGPICVLLRYDAQGVLQQWCPYQHKNCWNNDKRWFFSPTAAYIVVSRDGDMPEQQRAQTCVFEFTETDFKLISSHHAVLHGGTLWRADVSGLLSSDKGYVLYGGLESEDNNYKFSINAVNLDSGQAWQRSLKGMQPKWDRCCYGQRITPLDLPDGWVALDIRGDNWGLTDCAWFWHVPTDRFFALPIAAVVDDKENADFHYQPSLNCLFALSDGYDRNPILERLVDFPSFIHSLESTQSCLRVVSPWQMV